VGRVETYLAMDELDDLMFWLMGSYRDSVLMQIQIGETYEWRPIWAYVLMETEGVNRRSEEDMKKELASREILFINSAHHAREFTTISVQMYTLFQVLHSWEHRDVAIRKLLKEMAIVFVPVVNVDSVKYISDHYDNIGKFKFIRKNRHITQDMSDCRREEDKGVDLNRNYMYEFAHDRIGSSGNSCQEDYRGESGGSEPETQAVTSFLYDNPKVRVALNLHAYGPLFIIPFNFDEQAGNALLKSKADYAKAYEFYTEIFDNAGVPSSYTFGNGATTIGYTANGEASDWMLQERGIYAMSPEIGIEDSRSNTFFIRDPAVLLDVCQQNYVWIRGIMERFSDRLYLFFE